MSITIIVSYYDQGKEYIDKHLRNWETFDSNYNFIIIDDCSKKLPFDITWVKNLKKTIDCYVINTDINCNIPGSRNLGVHMAKTDWIMICDMDTIVTLDCSKGMLKYISDIDNEKSIIKFNRKVPSNTQHEKHLMIHPGICMLKRNAYLSVNGCDEDFSGNYGYYTLSMETQLINLGYDIKCCYDLFVDYIPEADCKDIKKDKTINRMLLKTKKKYKNWSKDIMRFKYARL